MIDKIIEPVDVILYVLLQLFCIKHVSEDVNLLYESVHYNIII